MTLADFLEMIDRATEAMSHEELLELIRGLARVIPENRREQFRRRLEKKIHRATSLFEVEVQNTEDLRNQLNEMKILLKSIEEGDICLDSDYSEEWDSWDDEGKVELLDPQGVVRVIESAIRLMGCCLDMELYPEGLELAEILSALPIWVNGEWEDYYGSKDLYIRDLYDYDLMSGSMDALKMDELRLAWMGSREEERADKIYDIIANLGEYKPFLKLLVQQYQGGLPGFTAFLPAWIGLLGLQSDVVNELLDEALSMLESEEEQLEYARCFAHTHPELWKQILEKKDDADRGIRIGMEALERIPANKSIRSDIALTTARYAEKSANSQLKEACWLEAFRSETTAPNYLRLRMNVRNWEDIKEEVRKIYGQGWEDRLQKEKENTFYYSRPVRDNQISKKDYYTILFFEGEFEKLIREGMDKKEALGWSGSYMKEGITLFLMLLHAGEKDSRGMLNLMGRVEELCGFGKSILYSKTDDMSSVYPGGFQNMFKEWKKTVDISPKDREEWFNWISRLLEKRTKAIMDGNRRNYYGECAAFIEAYGAARESSGEAGARERIMQEYKETYPRRRNFIQALKALGMRG